MSKSGMNRHVQNYENVVPQVSLRAWTVSDLQVSLLDIRWWTMNCMTSKLLDMISFLFYMEPKWTLCTYESFEHRQTKKKKELGKITDRWRGRWRRPSSSARMTQTVCYLSAFSLSYSFFFLLSPWTFDKFRHDMSDLGSRHSVFAPRVLLCPFPWPSLSFHLL